MGKTSRTKHPEEMYAGIELPETEEILSITKQWSVKEEWAEANKDNPDAKPEKKDCWLEIFLTCEIVHPSRLVPPTEWKRSSVNLVRLGKHNYASVLNDCLLQLAGQNGGGQ